MDRFPIPLARMIPIKSNEFLLDPHPHPFETAHRSEIARHWTVEKAAQPALYDGKLVLFSELRIIDDRLYGRCHAVNYATLLYWHTQRPHPLVAHCFAHAVLISSDDHLVAIRMGKNTANAGSVYFAAGSLELADFHDGRADLTANMQREVREETGLDLSGLQHKPHDHVLATEAGTVIFRRYRLAMDSREVSDAIKAHIAGDPDPEIAEPVIIASQKDSPPGLLRHMALFRDWHFANPPTV